LVKQYTSLSDGRTFVIVQAEPYIFLLYINLSQTLYVHKREARARLTIDSMTLESWDHIISVNLRAPFALTMAFLRTMKERGRGNIINITSRSAERANLAQLAYCPSKYGLEGLTQCLALELKEYNIAVNSLNVASPPGLRLKPNALTLKEAEKVPDSERIVRRAREREKFTYRIFE